MTISWRRVLLISVLCYLVGMAFSAVMAIFSYSIQDVLPAFQYEWIVATAWSSFFGYLPVLQGWALLISFSILPETASRVNNAIAAGVQAVTPAIILVVVLTLGYILLIAIADPRVSRSVSDLEYTSALARGMLERGQEAMEFATEPQAEPEQRRMRYEEAIDAFESYLAIVEEDSDIGALLEDARNRLAYLPTSSAPSAEEPDAQPDDQGRSADGYIDRAIAALDSGDYASAHYFASLAERLQPDGEAAAIAASALSRMEEAATPGESERRSLFDRKLEAKQLLSNGQVVPAYYRFAELREEYPRDVDVSRYYELAVEAVERRAVFADEVGEALEYPGRHQVIFANRQDEEYHELVFFATLVDAPTGLYARDIEVVRFTPEGSIIYHLSAPYGKVIEGDLVMRVLDETDPDAREEPGYWAGGQPEEVDHIVSLTPSHTELLILAEGSDDSRSIGVGRLSSVPQTFESHGLFETPVYHEMLRRLALPFLFAITSFVAIGFAWRNRSRYLTRPPLTAFLLVPFMPFALHPIYELFLYSHTLLTAWMVIAVGFVIALVILLAIEVVFLVVSLAYLAIALSS